MQLSSMAPSKSFLLSRAEVLGVYGDTFFNRVTLVNNATPLTKSRCWVHQTASDICEFLPEDRVDCSCGFNRQGHATCAQKKYVDEILGSIWDNCPAQDRAGLVSFGTTRCVGLLLNDGLYLFSAIQACGMRTSFDDRTALKRSLTHTTVLTESDIVCSNCREAAMSTLPNFNNVVLALKGLLHNGDTSRDGLTLMKKFAINNDDNSLEQSVYHALEQAQDLAKAVGILEGLVKNDNQHSSFEMGADTVLIQSCNDLAESLISSCRTELVAVCSTLVGHVNEYCQPPLKVRLRWMRHFMALEYRIEFSADYSNCFFDEISGRYATDIDRQKVVLHEIVQCSQISLGNVEGCFRLALHRMRDYLAVRDSFNAKNEPDVDLQFGNDTAAYTSTDVAPFWWNYYCFSNTLGEGDSGSEHYTVKRLTRSQIVRSHEDGASTPIARKSRHTLDEHLVATHCVSSDNLGHSQATTFEAPSNSRKDLGDFHRSEGSNNSLHSKTTPCMSQRSLKSPSNDKLGDLSTCCDSVCFCFKNLESVSTFGRHFVAQEFRQHNSLCCAIFGDSPYSEGLEDIYNGCQLEDWDEYKTATALRRSIKAALEASTSLGRAFLNDKSNANNLLGNSIKVLNTALLSTLRLGDSLYLSRNAMETHLGDQEHPVKEYYDTGDAMEDAGSGDSCSSESTLRDIISNSFVLSNSGFQGLYSTFENDQYIQHDLDESEDAALHSPKTTVTHSPRRKESSPARSHSHNHNRHSSIDSQAEVSSRQSRKAARDASSSEVYIYDLSERNDALSESAVEDWYESDGSARGSRRQRQKPNTASLTEIYGNHDALIPMGPLPIGVYFDASRKLWRCQWRENGKFRTKGFSLGHYSSLCEARRACILFRCQVGNMPVQPEWLNPNYVQVSQLLSKRSTATSTSTSTPKKSKRKRKSHGSSMEVDPVK
ncbi:AP2/ERF domain-containing protein [Babesia sp. Xinjiang]|uniref:AP2/ERF domain-containing protein n=1 Tax=Babesia sp. Xinjiang TaxID=462227 RepID=UPI000A2316DF|nr:AP2/ERF domain-containing protein [Babesia sp. Xinjiang]ORM40802.1 AP2/ERF domain-containing protein [Babesia sp. Xinjiang]